MCFGNNVSQKDSSKFPPVPNNYCGGFALDAVLTDGKPEDANPKGTYDKIMDKQKDLEAESSSAEFIDATEKNDTYMSLPSGIALVAKDKGLDVKVLFHSFLRKIPVFEDVIKEEVICLDGMVTEVKEGDFWSTVEKEASDCPYFIVLVHNSHWVAVKKITENNFVCYNPGNGECTEEGAESMTKALCKAGYWGEKINPLVIALKK